MFLVLIGYCLFVLFGCLDDALFWFGLLLFGWRLCLPCFCLMTFNCVTLYFLLGCLLISSFVCCVV